jgi:hypothetical protein
MSMGRSFEADREPSVMVTVTPSCSLWTVLLTRELSLEHLVCLPGADVPSQTVTARRRRAA